MNGQDPATGAWRDGMFSHAAPLQDYQASVKQFQEGSLGAVRLRAPHGRRHGRAMSGAFQDGTLGRSFLPAFTPQQMQGLGYAYRDGSLGDDITTTVAGAACDTLGPCVDNFISKRLGAGEAMDQSLKVPFNQVMVAAVLGLGAAVAYLYSKR